MLTLWPSTLLPGNVILQVSKSCFSMPWVVYGMVKYLARFFPPLSSTLEPLYQLMSKKTMNGNGIRSRNGFFTVKEVLPDAPPAIF